jgi:four helix bundle protein
MNLIRFTDTIAWQRAHALVISVYGLSSRFPGRERYGLTAQIRRAAVSIPANFVEGFRRHSPAEKIRFYNMAQASGEETRYYLILARDLGYGEQTESWVLLDEAMALLEGYIRSIRKRIPAPREGRKKRALPSIGPGTRRDE